MSSEVETSRDLTFRQLNGIPPLRFASLGMTTPLFTVLHIYHDNAPHSSAMNMAIDEALLEHAAVPSIRFYQWHSPALSFGYFGKFADVADYSIVIPASDEAFAESSMSIYEKIHRVLSDSLIELGQPAVVAGGVDPGRTEAATRAAITDRGYNCFANPVRADVMIDDCKVAGAAQRRTWLGLLQQGSIQGVDLGNGLADRFAKALSANCIERKINEGILNRARELAHRKYGDDYWLRKR